MNDNQLNETIYELGKQYAIYPNKWSMVRQKLADDYDVFDLTNNAIRKRFKRYEKRLKKEKYTFVSDIKSVDFQYHIDGVWVEGESSKLKPHTPDYQNNVPFKADNVLIVSDTHIPFEAKGYLDFILRLRDKHKCDTVIHIGDILDECAVSAWATDPDGLSSGSELEKAYKTIQKWNKAIPDMNICLGNHDIRHMTLAYKSGLSKKYLRHFNDIYDVNWNWNWSYLQDGDKGRVLYTHGSEKGGQYAHINLSKEEGMSTVIGHTHAHAGVNWFKTRTKQWFALNVGCAIDESSYAFAYGQHKAYKCIIGAGLVLNQGTKPEFVLYE